MTCQRCQEDPHLPPNSPRRCAFDDQGNFTPDNWACATMGALHRSSEEVFCQDDERLFVLPADFDEFFGLVVVQRYKYRGRAQGAAVFDTERGGTLPLTLQLAERALQT